MKRCCLLIIIAAMCCMHYAWGQPKRREPAIAYAYPAGGQQGTTFRVDVGGQALQNVKSVHITGDGIQATVSYHVRPLNNTVRQELGKRLRLLRKQHNNPDAVTEEDLATVNPEIKLPAHPLLEDLESKSMAALQEITREFLGPNKNRNNPQLAERAVLEVKIAPDAAPGDRELRLRTPLGLSNPLCFQVGALPERREMEPNEPSAMRKKKAEAPLELPVLINGQIQPGDVDCFQFTARTKQRLVISAKARHLVPYLADAVPGWFQATLALYDPQGQEVAFVDDYQFEPDPVLFFEVPTDGIYTLELRDSIYRGRDDFVYRIAIGEQPFVTQLFPLGGQEGIKTEARMEGWNLVDRKVPLDTHGGGGAIRYLNANVANPAPYAVDTLPEFLEEEENDSIATSCGIELPVTINGKIGKPKDVDVYRFIGRSGDTVVAEVLARRLHSPLDALLKLTDGADQVLEWNDDTVDKEQGMLTHHADAKLTAMLPHDGIYYLQLSDTRQEGGDAYAYRLRVSAPRPSFALRMHPSALNIPARMSMPVTVHVIRKDDFWGDITIQFKDAPEGFSLSGNVIPEGRDSIRMTITAPPKPIPLPLALEFVGVAETIDGEAIRCDVVPADDRMQAFLYRHLVPAQQFLVQVTGSPRGVRSIVFNENFSLQLPAGGSAKLHVAVPPTPILDKVQLTLDNPPDGISIGKITAVENGLDFILKASDQTEPDFILDTLIIEASAYMTPNPDAKGPAKRKRHVSFGYLPAIPYTVIAP